MNAADFLSLLLPEQGFIILAEPLDIPGLSSQPYRHHVFSEIEPAALKATELSFEHQNVFFALAGYREEKVFNPTHKNRDGTTGKWQVRTQANAGWLRSLFLDIDVDDTKPDTHFGSKEEAVAGLRAFCAKVGLPSPLLVDSGGGVHAYWPLDRDMPRDEWQVLADQLKGVCGAEKLRIDPAVPADAARVLRVLGCPNLKRPAARPVFLLDEGDAPTSPEQIASAFAAYTTAHGPLPTTTRKYQAPAVPGALGGNMEEEVSPISFGNVMFACGVIGGQVADAGASANEPLWRAVVGIAKFASDQRAALLSVSCGHPSFSEGELDEYVGKWKARPTTCGYFKDALGCPECASCPHLGKIGSPASLGNMVIEADAPTITLVDTDTGAEAEVELPDPPAPYVRRVDTKTGGNTICIRSEDANGVPYFIPVCPNDIYPVRILRQNDGGEITEKTQWRFHLARMAPATIEVPQGVLSDTKALHKFLLNVGVYATGSEAAATKDYMSAYLKKLASEVDRERVYHRLGWQFGGEHDEKRVGFILGTKHVAMDGTVTPCNVHQNVRNTLKNGVHSMGSKLLWSELVNNHYVGDTYRAHRFFIYCAFAAPLFHLSGHKGALIAANGRSGRGKTTVLAVGSSIWGSPDALMLNGNPDGSTFNAMYNHLGTLHSLPMMWDDTTERAGADMLKTALNISQGVGKQRLRGAEHDGNQTTWETMVLSSTNYDNIAQALAARNGTDANLMRMLGVTFDDFPANNSKTDADRFIAAIRENYGHAGLPFMQYVAANYEIVKRRAADRSAQLDVENKVQAHERYWSWIIAIAQIAAEIAQELGLINFPLATDFLWMRDHINEVREAHQELTHDDPVEQLSNYLEANLSSTLVLSTKLTSNLDNVALRPHGSLTIRHEMDRGLLFVNRAEVSKFCATHNINLKGWEHELTIVGVLLDRSRLKTLGADTSFAKGQVRCWMLDATKLGTRFASTVTAAAKASVTALQPTGT